MATAEETARMLQGIADRLADMRPVMEVVAADVRLKMDDAIGSGKSVLDGTAYAALSHTTLEIAYAKSLGRALRRHYTTHERDMDAAGRARHLTRFARSTRDRKPLLDTGRLRASLTTAVNRRGFNFGSNVIYAATQNFGRADNKVFGGPLGPIPSRKFLPVSQDGRSLEPTAFWSEQIAHITAWIKTGVLPV